LADAATRPGGRTAVDAAPAAAGARAVPAVADFARAVCESEALTPRQLDEFLSDLMPRCGDARALARELLRREWLTAYQINELARGRGQGLRLGPYLLLARLGAGGMGTVFKALHRRLARLTAIKVVSGERLADGAKAGRFLREIQATALLNHPNLVYAYDADQAGDGYYLAMEYVEGTDLDRLVRQRGPLPAAEACAYVRQAALGLQHAHERGVVHRDVKPSNLLLDTRGGVVKVSDLGLARLRALPGDGLTRVGALLGTTDYMAPEQITDPHGADRRADQYGLGCTLYFLLTGRVPFPERQPMRKLLQHCLDEPRPVEELRPGLPRAVGAVVRRLMAKEPAARYPSAGDAAAALADAAGGAT
jgi:serine/threonine-protein kinase